MWRWFFLRLFANCDFVISYSKRYNSIQLVLAKIATKLYSYCLQWATDKRRAQQQEEKNRRRKERIKQRAKTNKVSINLILHINLASTVSRRLSDGRLAPFELLFVSWVSKESRRMGLVCHRSPWNLNSQIELTMTTTKAQQNANNIKPEKCQLSMQRSKTKSNEKNAPPNQHKMCEYKDITWKTSPIACLLFDDDVSLLRCGEIYDEQRRMTKLCLTREIVRVVVVDVCMLQLTFVRLIFSKYLSENKINCDKIDVQLMLLCVSAFWHRSTCSLQNALLFAQIGLDLIIIDEVSMPCYCYSACRSNREEKCVQLLHKQKSLSFCFYR